MAVSANRLELLQIADAVAREKSIDKGIVIASMEDALQKAARLRYGQETEVRAEINQKTGEVRAYPPSYPGGCDGAPVGYLMWDCDPSAQHKTGPSWALTNEGVAVLAQGYAHVTAALNGRGPIVSFAALARAGILNTSSSTAHLWKDAKPAPTDAAACTAAYDGDPTLLRWSVVDSGS